MHTTSHFCTIQIGIEYVFILNGSYPALRIDLLTACKREIGLRIPRTATTHWGESSKIVVVF
jgi:hypothetical protein